MRRQESLMGFCLLAPALLLLIFLFVLPLIYSMYLSLYDVGFAKDTWIGLENYRNLASQGGYWDALRVSGKFLTANLFFSLVLAYILGLALSGFGDKFRGTFLTFYYIPGLFSGMITLTAWRWFYRYPGGGFNSLLKLFHLPPIRWLSSVTIAPWAVCFVMMSLMTSGAVILYVAAIAQIDRELIEAAKIDGANELQIIWCIITPLTHRVRLYIFLVNFIGALQIWEHPFFYTGGGPLGSTTTVMLKIYHKAFIEGDLGMGNAMTTITAFSVLGMALVIVRHLREFLG